MGGRKLKRMAGRMVKRAGIQGEEGVTVSFGFGSLLSSIFIGFLDEIPYIGLFLTFLTFGVHRIVLVTNAHTYVYKSKPFHRPGKLLGTFAISPDAVSRKRGKLTFADGVKVWHSPLFAARAKRVAQAANGSA
jgi:hypothetical protein